jgi:Tat protein translocase TatB subunit
LTKLRKCTYIPPIVPTGVSFFMFGIGMQELIIIAIIALLVVGPKRLPDLAKSLGKGFSEFRRAAEDVSEGVKNSLQAEDLKKEAEDLKNAVTGDENAADEKDKDKAPDDDTETAAPTPPKPSDPSRS